MLATAWAEDRVPWVTDLEAARQLAAQQQRPVLVHFWTEDCAPCRMVERDVFSQPHVAAALQQQCIPVKINAREYPQVAQQLGVDRWPTDVVLTSDMRLVDKTVSPADPQQYLQRVSGMLGRLGPAPSAVAPGPPGAQLWQVSNSAPTAAPASFAAPGPTGSPTNAYDPQSAPAQSGPSTTYDPMQPPHGSYPTPGPPPTVGSGTHQAIAPGAAGPSTYAPVGYQPGMEAQAPASQTAPGYSTTPAFGAPQPYHAPPAYGAPGNNPGPQPNAGYAPPPPAEPQMVTNPFVNQGTAGAPAGTVDAGYAAANNGAPGYPPNGGYAPQGGPVSPGGTPSSPPAAGPTQPAYGAAAQGTYGTPGQPAYGAPAPPAYGAPAQPAYGVPAQPAYGAPAQPTYDPAASGSGYAANAAPTGQAAPGWENGNSQQPAMTGTAPTPSNPADAATPAGSSYSTAPGATGPMGEASAVNMQGSPATPGGAAALAQPAARAANGQQLGLDGYCPVTLADEKKWTEGDPRWGAVHRGRTYLFANEQARQRFMANPDSFSPMLSGFDPVSYIDSNQMVEGSRAHGIVYRDQVFLFSSEDNLNRFCQNPNRYEGSVLQAMGGQRASDGNVVR